MVWQKYPSKCDHVVVHVQFNKDIDEFFMEWSDLLSSKIIIKLAENKIMEGELKDWAALFLELEWKGGEGYT